MIMFYLSTFIKSFQRFHIQQQIFLSNRSLNTIRHWARSIFMKNKSAIDKKNTVQIQQNTLDEITSLNNESTRRDNRFIAIVNEVIALNFSDAEFNVNKLSSEIGISNRHLQRNFRNSFQLTPSKYIRDYRLEAAIILLKKGEPINSVVYSVGFLSHSYFSRCFKEKFELSPSQYLVNIDYSSN